MTTPADDPNRDLGLGSRLAQGSGARFLNRDGSFNVVRLGLPFLRSLNLYHTLITMPWRAFFGVVAVFYLVLNLGFASAYLAVGPGALEGALGITSAERFSQAFFFSVQTFATIGYGVIHPKGLAANLLVHARGARRLDESRAGHRDPVRTLLAAASPHPVQPHRRGGALPWHHGAHVPDRQRAQQPDDRGGGEAQR